MFSSQLRNLERIVFKRFIGQSVHFIAQNQSVFFFFVNGVIGDLFGIARLFDPNDIEVFFFKF